MLIPLNASQVVLQIAAQNLDGTPKLNVVSALVRVFRIDGSGAEIEVLSSTALVRIGSTHVWRYKWNPSSLPVNDYFVEYTLVDSDTLQFIGFEDLTVRDIAVQTDLLVLKQVETGRWKIVANQMIFYDNDGVTPILIFNLKDEAGLPTMNDVFERVPV